MFDALVRRSNFYRYFKENAILNHTDGNCRTYYFEYNGKHILIKKTLKRADKRVIVTCAGHTVQGVRLVPVTIHTVAKEVDFNIDVAGMTGDGAAIVVISGKPGLIKGLDEGIFVSANGDPKDKKCVYVMSEARFRGFELKEWCFKI